MGIASCCGRVTHGRCKPPRIASDAGWLTPRAVRAEVAIAGAAWGR